jgi:hypothetical protein
MIGKKKNKKMTAQQIFSHTTKAEIKKIGKKTMVVLPIKIWRDIEDYIEDIEMERSKTLAKKIQHARAEKKTYSLEEVRKNLGL